MITNLSSNCDKINLHGYDIHIYENTVKIFVGKKKKANAEFKDTANKLMIYLVAEMFIPNKQMKVELIYK